MRIIHRVENQVAVLTPYGRLAVDGVDTMRVLVDSLLSEKEIKTILINFEDITMLDSSGIALLVRVHKTLMARGSVLSLCEVYGKYLDTLRLCGLTRVFKIHDSEQEALSHI